MGRNGLSRAQWVSKGVSLLLCLTLSACGVGDLTDGGAGGTEGMDTTPGPVSLPGQAAGIREEETLLTVDGRAVPAWEYLYWLALACDRARGQASGGTPEWRSDADGMTVAERVKEQALMNTALYAAVETLAERYGVTPDAADGEAVAERWRRRCEAYGGEEAYLSEIARYGLDRERAETLFRVALLYEKLRELCEEGGALAPDAAELDALAKESGTVQIDRILSADGDRSAARRRAEAFFVQLNRSTDQAALFTELTWEGSDHTGPRTLKDGTFDATLTRVAREMHIGQVSGIIETEEGFSILRRLPPDRDSLLETWLRRTVEETARAADVELTERCLSLDPETFAAALNEQRDEARRAA